MIKTYNVGIINWEPWEWILIPGLIVIIYFLGARYKTKKIGQNPEYRYFLTGLMFKVFAGLFFGIIYVFYYGGGDTISYYSSAIPLSRLFWENSSDYFQVMINSTEITHSYSQMEWEAYTFNVFTNSTGIPLSFISHDPKTFIVSKLVSPLLIITGESYFASTILLAAITYIPIWVLFRLFLKYFPLLHRELAISIIFIPSVAFWGSGIMKDTFTFSSTVMAVFAFNELLTRDKNWVKKLGYLLLLLLMCFITLSIKPYILNVLVPSLGIWLVGHSIKRISNPIFKFLVLPILFLVGIGSSFYLLRSLGSSMDKFSLDNAIKTAQVTQEDLSRAEQYGDNNFDIGKIDGSIPNLVSKFPQAVVAGLYRPFIFEAKSPVMFLSAIENLFLIGLLIITLLKVKISLIYHLIKATPILIFCITFSILFAFMLGITTPNFGALVRFKIPLVPFYTTMIMILYSTKKLSLVTNQ